MEAPETHDNKSTFAYFLIKHRFELIFFAIQAGIIVLFGLFTTFGDAGRLTLEVTPEEVAGRASYPFLQDLNVVLFLGFGFAMSFLRAHSWTSIGLNFLIGVLVIQVYILSNGLWVCV